MLATAARDEQERSSSNPSIGILRISCVEGRIRFGMRTCQLLLRRLGLKGRSAKAEFFKGTA